jgi:hypothetical protein
MFGYEKIFRKTFETDLSKLIYYFERHELDSDTHGPMAMQMINELCGSDAKWAEVEEIAKMALDKRIGLWDAIEESLTAKVAMA